MSEPSKTSRREFLTGKSAVEAAADAVLGPPPQTPLPQALRPAERHLLSVSREAMACLFEVVFDAACYRAATDEAIAALELVARLEDQLTVYRDTSEVMHVNRLAAQEPVVVEAGLFQLLQRAVALSEATLGAVDITAGPLAKVWGFYRRQGRMPVPDEIQAALSLVGSPFLQLNPAASSVQFQKPGMELNLGAVGKGYALDRAADHLLNAGMRDFLIHGGNSSVLARGRRSSELKTENPELAADNSTFPTPHSAFWTVALRHPLRPDIRLAEFSLVDQALGTSGSGTQYFHHQGRRYGHIIDPRTGWPAEQVLSATVIAPTAEQADALSTALYVLGLEQAHKFCADHPDVSALLTTQGVRAGSVELHPINLADDRWRRIDQGQTG